MKDRKRQSREIFADALELPAEQRACYVAERAAGDLELLADVESLLAYAEDREGDLLASPGREFNGGIRQGLLEDLRSALRENVRREAAPGERPELEIGERLDSYLIRDLLGEGAFGTVWAAEQLEPVRRPVAIKILKAGVDTRQVLARFEVERQALAMMDHPFIAKILDAGATEKGRPYFVMERVQGIPILDYAEENALDVKARLELFLKVCRAVQHAHEKGIIHRDIKPSNVLVASVDDAPMPKLIDFGIVKSTQPALTLAAAFTQHGQLLGTPGYMSPEQAEGGGLEIDGRADVYSLGALLYELLTGARLFDFGSHSAAGLTAVLRVIREVDPPKPSVRVLGLAGVSGRGEKTLAAAMERRDARSLARLLRGDLDWIVMKSLEKDRARRYESVCDLAEDLDRHLRGEVVKARPRGLPRLLTRLGVGRHGGVPALLMAATLALAMPLAFGFWGAPAGDFPDDSPAAAFSSMAQGPAAPAQNSAARNVEVQSAEVQSAEVQSVDPLTEEERAWLRAHPVLKLAPSEDYPPTEWFDAEGAYRGITAEYVSLIEERLDFTFEIVRRHHPGRTPETLIADLRPLSAVTPDRREHWRFTEPYLVFPAVIIVRRSVAGELTPDDLAGRRVAVVENYAAQEWLGRNYPEIMLEPVPMTLDGVRKVAFGSVHAFISDIPVATWYIEQEGITNLRIAGKTGFSYEMGFGIRKDWPELVSILEKGLATISAEERRQIYQRWVSLDPLALP